MLSSQGIVDFVTNGASGAAGGHGHGHGSNKGGHGGHGSNKGGKKPSKKNSNKDKPKITRSDEEKRLHEAAYADFKMKQAVLLARVASREITREECKKSVDLAHAEMLKVCAEVEQKFRPAAPAVPAPPADQKDQKATPTEEIALLRAKVDEYENTQAVLLARLDEYENTQNALLARLSALEAKLGN